MKLLALAAVLTAAIFVSGCVEISDRKMIEQCRRNHCTLNVMLALETDENAKLKSIRVTRSSGIASADRRVVEMAKRFFPQKIPKPRKNFTYIMPGQVRP